MRILVISPNFAPSANSEAFCAAKWVLALQEAGADLFVLYNLNASMKPLNDSSGSWSSLASYSLGLKTSNKRNLTTRVLSSVRYQTWAWPSWIELAVGKGKQLHHKKPFDLIVVRSLPWYSVVAGYWIAKAIRRPWIAIINDPWNLWKFSPEKNARTSSANMLLVEYWLKRCLGTANSVVFPCSRLAGYFGRDRQIASQAIIPHIGWKRGNSTNSNQFTLVHAGLLGANEGTGRSGIALLQGLARFFERTPNAKPNCRMVFVGPEDPTTARICSQLNLIDIVQNIGRVSYEESLRFIGMSSACVLVEGQFEEGVFLPSKLADYLAALKPVLSLSPPNGTIADFPKDCGIFRVDPDDVEGIASTIGFLYEKFRHGELWMLSPIKCLVKQFEPQIIAKSFLNIAEKVVNL